MASSVSTRSDTTLVQEDDTETVVDEGERGRGLSMVESVDGEGERSRKNTPTGNEIGESRKLEEGVERDREEQARHTNSEVSGLENDGGLEGEGEVGKEGEGEGGKEGEGEGGMEGEGKGGEGEGRKEGEGEGVKEGDGEGEVCARQMSVVFRQELLNTVHLKIDSRIGLEIAKLSDSHCDIVQLIGRCLPHIVPNVILAKREVRRKIHVYICVCLLHFQIFHGICFMTAYLSLSLSLSLSLCMCQELIPVLLSVIASHPDSKTRDQLLHIMFNLIKRPDRHQR